MIEKKKYFLHLPVCHEASPKPQKHSTLVLRLQAERELTDPNYGNVGYAQAHWNSAHTLTRNLRLRSETTLYFCFAYVSYVGLWYFYEFLPISLRNAYVSVV